MAASYRKKWRQPWLWLAIILLAVGAIAAISSDISRRANGMRAAATRASDVAHTQPGAPLKVVVRLISRTNQTAFDALILESTNGSDYAETSSRLKITLDQTTAVVMGAPADLKVGAIVQVKGIAATAHTVLASQIVILTGFVHLKHKG